MRPAALTNRGRGTASPTSGQIKRCQRKDMPGTEDLDMIAPLLERLHEERMRARGQADKADHRDLHLRRVLHPDFAVHCSIQP